jgi:signal transduction histidine kinase
VVGVIREDDAAIVVAEDAAALLRRYLGPMRPVRRVRARVRALSVGQADLLLAVGIALVNAAELLTGDVHGRARVLGIALALPFNLPLAGRRRAPLPALGAVLAVGGLSVALDSGLLADKGPASVIATFMLATYSTARHCHQWPALGGLALAMGGLALLLGIENGGLGADDLLWIAGLCTLPWLAGRALRNSNGLRRELEQRARYLEREREDNARLAVEAERARIARELHAVVAQSVSAMVVQAGAARRAAAQDPETARMGFAAVEQTGRAALAEMRRLLGMLRTDEEELALAPQPSLSQLEVLVATARAAVPVELRLEGDPGTLLPGVDLAAFRVVQEALASAVRQAGVSRARVTVRYSERDIELEIADDGGSLPDGAGRGTTGIRERITMYGGELRAGSDGAGDYVVRARLPRTGRGA